MSVPTHGYDCQTLKYYRTTCSYCRSNVFYFECSCGSKIFLEGSGLLHFCGNQTKSRKLAAADETITNLFVVKKLVKNQYLNKQPLKKPLTSADIHQLWLDYLDSLEWFNFCGNCQKPIKTRTANVEHKFLADNNGVVEKEKISRYGDIPSHHEIVGLDGTAVFNPSYKGRIRYKFVEKYRVFNTKCNCPFKEKRRLNKN